MITQEYLKSILDYNEETGYFTWKIKKSANIVVGSIAGTLNHSGYWQIGIDKKLYSSHRLVWLFIFNSYPTSQIDHINCKKDDNRLVNLRLATPAENQWNRGKPVNNTTGFKGVSWSKKSNKYQAQISKNGKKIHLGFFNSAEQASKAYKDFAKEHTGEFYFEN